MDKEPIVSSIASAASIGKKLYKGKILLRMLLVAIMTLMAFMLGMYGATAVVSDGGQYTVFVSDDKTSTQGISLSETSDFANPSVRLECKGIESMTNISERNIPTGLHDLEGSNNGANYIAYTFFLKNIGNDTISVEESMQIESTIKGTDEAVRVRVYKNGEEKTYAKLGADGMPEYGTIPFGEEKVFKIVAQNVKAGDIIRYTIVIWLEGDDPQCLDNIRGGAVKLSMSFAIVNEQSKT